MKRKEMGRKGRNKPVEKILAIGYSVRHIVCSGTGAGYEMYAADAFGDDDTIRCAERYMPLEDITSIKHVVEAVDGILFGSGLEAADPGFITEDKILGNPPGRMRQVSNKAWLAARLDELNVPHPRTCIMEDMKYRKLSYPVVVKPIYGGGGTKNVLCMNENDLAVFEDSGSDFICQEYIKGRHASVSTLSTGKEVISVSVNEQLIGMDSLHAPGTFAYCGNITPLVSQASGRMCEIAEFLTLEFGLKGTNGFDFVISNEGQPFLIEVNPRFQGSLDTIELSTGLNLVDAVVKAVRSGSLPDRIATQRYAVKLILYAERDVVASIKFEDGFVDIPPDGRVIRAGQPVASCMGTGATRAAAIAAAMRKLARLKAEL